MTQWIAISRAQHADARYLPRESYTFAANQPVADILLAKLNKLLPQYVLGFIKQGESYQPVALLSLDGTQNLYVAPSGEWLSNYVPAALRGYPFILGHAEESQKALCIDSDALRDDGGESLFDDNEALSYKVARVFDFLKKCDKNRQMTRASTKALNDADVIEPWPLQIAFDEGQEPLEVNDLYRINEKALNSLDAQAYAALRGGPMMLAYALLFSMGQLNQLTERARFHQKSHDQQQGITQFSESLDELLEGDDLTFDFDE